MWFGVGCRVPGRDGANTPTKSKRIATVAGLPHAPGRSKRLSLAIVVLPLWRNVITREGHQFFLLQFSIGIGQKRMLVCGCGPAPKIRGRLDTSRQSGVKWRLYMGLHSGYCMQMYAFRVRSRRGKTLCHI